MVMDGRHPLRRVWDDVTGRTPDDLLSPLKRDEIVKRLTAAIDRGWAFFGSKPVVGQVDANAFRLRWRIGYRNSFQTVMFGRFVDEARGTRLACRSGMHPAVTAFMALWFAFVTPLAFVSVSALVNGASDPALFISVLMLAFGVVLVAFGRWLARDERARLIAFLEQVAQARRTG
jgi:hypothetical protein